MVNNSSRRALLFDSTFSTLMLDKRLPIVPVDSSAARIPFPGVPMYAALAMSSSANCYESNQAFIIKQLTAFKIGKRGDEQINIVSKKVDLPQPS